MTTPVNETTNETTNVAPEAAPAPVVPSKMDKAKALFAGLADGTVPLAEGKSARATFIAQAQEAEIGMTKAGAATYWQNLTSAAKGGKLYPHTAAKKKTDAPTTGDEKPTEQPAEERLEAEELAEEAADKDPEDLSHLQ